MLPSGAGYCALLGFPGQSTTGCGTVLCFWCALHCLLIHSVSAATPKTTQEQVTGFGGHKFVWNTPTPPQPVPSRDGENSVHVVDQWVALQSTQWDWGGGCFQKENWRSCHLCLPLLVTETSCVRSSLLPAYFIYLKLTHKLPFQFLFAQ